VEEEEVVEEERRKEEGERDFESGCVIVCGFVGSCVVVCLGIGFNNVVGDVGEDGDN